MRTKPGNKIGTSKVQEAASEPATDGQTAASVVAGGGGLFDTPAAELDKTLGPVVTEAQHAKEELPKVEVKEVAGDNQAIRRLKEKEAAALDATFNVVDQRPAKFAVSVAGGPLQPRDMTGPRDDLARYKVLGRAHDALSPLVVRIETSMTVLAIRLREAGAPIYKLAKTVAESDSVAAATLKPATDFHGTSAATRRKRTEAERQQEARMTEAQRAAKRTAEAKAREDKKAAKAARHAKKI